MKTVDTKALPVLVGRNVKCFFKDKGMFFTSLITPLILLVLYATFLYKVYEDSFRASLPAGLAFDDKVLGGLVGGLLLSSLLAVSSVTVSFCANLFLVQDKVTGARTDFDVSPIKPSTLAVSYYLATVINAMLIGIVTAIVGFAYLAFTGWFLSALDVLLLALDIFLLVMFGTALSSLICYPLTSQGQLSAVGTIVSSGCGFICGAYMPISQFSTGLQRVLSFFPGTYGTSLVRNHALRGVCAQMAKDGLPQEAIDGIRKVADCDLQFFTHTVEVWTMYIVLIGSIAVLLGAYIVLHALREKKRAKDKNKGTGTR
ncbi:MAG: ABC transporter permease [Clostridia bacterium]|nr:ABC transporter permease [Clostridia bacterium]